ncbi:NADPH-dependent FMN reductase [Aestuariivirga sp.]|uniref:NADPH-dependent FMN reductase n=1 Tax=Aestuariivirga sp. TaxID=2650926 RepID=UPI0039E64A3F
MQLLAISGALRKGSTNTGLLRALKEMAPEGVTIDIATLHGIPLYDGDEEEAHGKPEAVKALDARIAKADGLIFACPEYNFSVPGVLKNATDWLSRRSTSFKWKRTGIVGAGAGFFHGTGRSQYHFRQNLQALQCIVMPRPEIFVNHNEEKFDKDGNLTDPTTRKFLGEWLTAFIEWVEKKP